MPGANPTTAPPRILTTEDYRKLWEPQGWRLLSIGPTATWRKEWGAWEAIRDIVQNALDETEGYTFGYDEQGLWIADEGKGVAVADFLLGPPKLKPPYARGAFGEGMKIAALALVRAGYKVKIETANKEVWIVFNTVQVNGRIEQLAALWRPNGRTGGTVFHIIGYTDSAFPDRFAVNIPRRDILHYSPILKEPVSRYNALIKSPPGRIYARDIYLQDINSPFSYNLWGFVMAPDRHGPRDAQQMHQDMGRTWATVGNVDLLARLLGMLVDPPVEATYETTHLDFTWMEKEPWSGHSYQFLMQANRQVWQQAWDQAVGKGTVLYTEEKWAPLVRHLNYESRRVFWAAADVLRTVLKTDVDLVSISAEQLRETKVIPDKDLTPLQQAHLGLARAIVRELSRRRDPVMGTHAAFIPPASDRSRTVGMYGGKTREIFLSLEALGQGRDTVDVTLHELAHHTSGGALDLTEPHVAEISRLSGELAADLVAGAFDTEIEDVGERGRWRGVRL